MAPVKKKDTPVFHVLSRALTGPALRDIYRSRPSSLLAAALRHSETLGGTRQSTLAQVFDRIFAAFKLSYRSDYVFRSAIARKIFLGRHSPASTLLIPEFRVWKSRADFVMFNGTSTAYEIKSSLDTTRRLQTQLGDYQKLFDRTYVVTDEHLLMSVAAEVPSSVGILALTPRFTISTVREASPNAGRIDLDTLVDALRTSELVRLTAVACGEAPRVAPVRMFDACKAELKRADIDPAKLHSHFVDIMKGRNSYGHNSFEAIPDSLLPAFIESGIDQANWLSLVDTINRTAVGDFLGV